MKELIDLKALWMWLIEKWRTSFVTIVALLVGFGAGGAVEKKSVTDDCKFMGAFRDGPQAYNCNQRIK